MRKCFLNIVYVCGLFLAVLPSCSRRALMIEDTSIKPDTEPIVLFSDYGEEQTKGASPVTDASLRISHFGLFAYWADNGTYFEGISDGHLWLDNREVVYSRTEEEVEYWSCSPVAYWPIGCGLTFFGYAPYMSCDGPILRLPNGDVSVMPRGTFTPDNDVASQVDFCLAAPVYDRKKTSGAVPMAFDHALSKVLFYFNLAGEKYDDDSRVWMVKSINLENVVGTNIFTYGGSTAFYWDELPREDVSSRSASYGLSLADGTLSYTPLPFAVDRASETGLARYEGVNIHEEGIMYLLPQPMTGITTATVIVSAYTYDSVDDEWNEVEDSEMDPIVLTLPEQTVWKKGQIVSYSASIAPRIPMAFNVTLSDWEGNVIEEVDFLHE